MNPISHEQSGAFIERFTLPPTGDGPLAGLRFAVKDIIDVAGYRTGCGNPTWLETHPPAVVSAVCVEQLLAAGAQCDGKTITDELAFSLLGENHFYGTPLNPAAPDRVPGGSSSGSASAVGCGLVDFALGSDTGGSVRVPASFCGTWGLRPSHGLISVAGVMPLAPTYDTVGIFARSADVLQRAAAVLLPGESTSASITRRPTIHLIPEVIELTDSDVCNALAPAISRVGEVLGAEVRQTSLAELCGDPRAADLGTWLEMYRVLQGAETVSSLGAWVAHARPALGPAAAAGFEFIKQNLDRTRVGEVAHRRERYCRQLQRALASGDLVCLPTAPTIAPVRGATSYDRKADFYGRTLSLTAISGVGRLPQVSVPLATVSSVPVGLSLLAGYGEDAYLLELALKIASERH